MYKIKGRDSNGNKFKIKVIPINYSMYSYIYYLSSINPDGTRSYTVYKSLNGVLCKVIGDGAKYDTITLKVKIKDSDKRIEVVGSPTDGKSSLIKYHIFIDGIVSYLYYDITSLTIRLENLIHTIEGECEKPTTPLTAKRVGLKVPQYYPIPANLRGGYGVGVAVYEIR